MKVGDLVEIKAKSVNKTALVLKVDVDLVKVGCSNLTTWLSKERVIEVISRGK